MKRVVNGLELEWSDMHDRLRRMLAKISKREERSRAAEDAQPGGGEAPVLEAQDAGTRTSLTPRQLQLQQQILNRRSRLATKDGE